MGGMILFREILEHVLQFGDGETLLMCREVSPEFVEAVKYLGRRRNIWEDCYSKEMGDKYPYCLISKIHPHNEGLSHPKQWGLIYESCLLRNFISSKEPSYLVKMEIGKQYCDIQDVETHDNLILVLVEYKKDYSRFYKIITISLENGLVNKSCRFYTNMLYITSIEDLSSVRINAITLPCDMCQLFAVPVCADETIIGYPKFSRNDDFVTIEHSNGEVLWINNFGKLLTKGKCFHTGKDAKHEEVKLKAHKMVKVFQGSTTLFISCGDTKREFNTFEDFRGIVTASLCYSNHLFLGTDTGMIYVYILSNEADLKALNLGQHIQQYNVCSNSILAINIMEMKNQVVIVCCSAKTLYRVHIKRKLQNFI